MTLQINDRPLVAITLLPMTDNSHELLRQLLTEAERPTIAPSQQVVRVTRSQALSARQKVMVPNAHDIRKPIRVRYAYD